MRKRIVLSILLALMTLPLDGCFLRLLLGFRTVDSISEVVGTVIDAAFAGATTSVCHDSFASHYNENTNSSTSTRAVDCSYVLNGQILTSTSTLIGENGLLGVFVDPLVLELPAAVTGLKGTFKRVGTTTAADLLIYPGFSKLPADDTHTITASPGKQLVVVDLPTSASVGGVDYEYSFSFNQSGTTLSVPLQVKAMFTGKVTVSGKTYFPPMMPCTTDFAAIPALTFPTGAAQSPFNIPPGFTGCPAGHEYSFEAIPLLCDLDNDRDVDRDDVAAVMAVRNMAASAGDPRDANRDGVINAVDARACAVQCTRGLCFP